MKAALKPRNDARVSSRPGQAAAPPDTLLFIAVASLVAIGLAMIFSASSAQAYADHHDTTYYVKRQVVYLVLGLLLAYGAYRIDYRKLRPLAPYALLLSFLALIAVLVPHVGLAAGGARRWIGHGALTLQPSEFAKLAVVLYLAAMLSSRNDRVTSLVRGLVPLCIPIFLVAMLIGAEPDYGTASLVIFTAFAMFFAAGARLEHFALIALATMPAIALTILGSSYRRARILAFLHPWKDPQNTGFHIVQSLLALGSGGLMGVGLGESRAKFFYLPEQYTDFIFSVLGEELGIIGTVSVVVLFLILAYRGIHVALRSRDRFGYYLAIGCTSMIVIQAFVNIGVVTSSWPVTGVPLPFISFGGTSLVACLVAVGLIANIGSSRRAATDG